MRRNAWILDIAFDFGIRCWNWKVVAVVVAVVVVVVVVVVVGVAVAVAVESHTKRLDSGEMKHTHTGK